MGLMVASSIAISFGGLIVRSFENPDPWRINLYRSIALVIAITLILLFQYRRETIPRVRGIGRAGLAGGVLLAVASIAFLQSLTHTTVANTLFILSAIPFITAGLARVFLGEGLQRATLITMSVAATGILVMVVEGLGIGSLYGNAMAILTAFCFSVFAVIIRRHRRIDMLPTLLVSGVVIGLAGLAVRMDELAMTWHDLLLCLFWGGLLSGLANWMFIVAARQLVAAEVTLFMLLEFALGALWVWLFVGEVPTSWSLLGGTLVIASVAVRAAIELRRPRWNARSGGPPAAGP